MFIYDKAINAMPYNKNILKLENFIASSIYYIINWLLIFLQSLLSSLRNSHSVKTILLFRTGSLGDILCAIPTFKAIRKNFPSVHLILLTHVEPIFNNRQTLTSLTGNKIFNEIIYYKTEDLRNLRKLSSLINSIKKHRIDIMIYLSQYDISFLRLLRDMLFFYFCGCKRLYGFRLNKHRIFKIAQRYYRAFATETERLLKVLSSLGIYAENPDFSLTITECDKRFIDNLLLTTQNFNNHPRIAINPTAKFSVNRWPKEDFLRLSRILVDKYNSFIILIGGDDARDVCKFIESDLRNRCLNLCGRTNFMQTAEILARCKLLISCDSGPVHLSAAVKAPVAGIYSARDYPNCWYPSGSKHIIVRHDVDCQVCLKTECQTMECIKGIGVEEVLFSCKKILDQSNLQYSYSTNEI